MVSYLQASPRLASQSKDEFSSFCQTDSTLLLTSSSLGGAHLLDCLHSSSRGDDDDLLAPGSPDDLLARTRCEDLLVASTGLVDDDRLLPTHRGHLHARLHLAADHPGPDGSDLGGSSS